MPAPTDVRVADLRFGYEDHLFRTPIKFGGTAIDRATVLNVEAVVETAAGRRATGFGSMPLGNVWSFPSRRLTYDDTLGAKKALTERVAALTAAHRDAGHPVDLTWALEPSYFRAADEVTRQLQL